MLRAKLYENPFLSTVASKCELTEKQGSRMFMDVFTGFGYYYQFFWGQDANRPRSNSAIMACNSSQMDKLALFHTQSRGSKTIVL